MEGWHARRMRMKVRVLAFASCPANMIMKMFPSTSAGEMAGRLVVFDGRPAPTKRSTCRHPLVNVLSRQ